MYHIQVMERVGAKSGKIRNLHLIAPKQKTCPMWISHEVRPLNLSYHLQYLYKTQPVPFGCYLWTYLRCWGLQTDYLATKFTGWKALDTLCDYTSFTNKTFPASAIVHLQVFKAGASTTNNWSVFCSSTLVALTVPVARDGMYWIGYLGGKDVFTAVKTKAASIQCV